jgi:hypothetical protein
LCTYQAHGCSDDVAAHGEHLSPVTVEETADGAKWLAGPISQVLSLLALGARSPANDDDVARVGERIPGLTRAGPRICLTGGSAQRPG